MGKISQALRGRTDTAASFFLKSVFIDHGCAALEAVQDTEEEGAYLGAPANRMSKAFSTGWKRYPVRINFMKSPSGVVCNRQRRRAA